MRRFGAAVVAITIVAVATSCYQDFDFTADHKADRWYVDEYGDWHDAASSTRVLDAEPGDLPVPDDYDGDHIWDRAVVRPNGDWITGSTVGTIHHPAPPQLPAFTSVGMSDLYLILPVPGDYDGDGRAEAAWYRDSDATWFIEGREPVVFGSGPTNPPGTSPAHLSFDQDVPVPADYDGDGTDDLATFNPRTMVWSVRSSIDGSDSTVTMTGNEGLALPAPADYDGVDHAQRATAGYEGWDIEGHPSVIPFGAGEAAVPAVADFDDDGRADRSYAVVDGGAWVTEGTDATFSVGTLDLDRYPLASGGNLIRNVVRITLVGRCSFDPAWWACT